MRPVSYTHLDVYKRQSPESIASVMQVSGTDPRVTEYVARTLLLASGYLREANEQALADLRAQQAHAIAEAYGCLLYTSKLMIPA